MGTAVIPKTLSATAVDVANGCLARFAAEMLNKSKGFQNTAANLGSTVHAALQSFVEDCYLNNTKSPDLALLLGYFMAHSVNNFGSTDYPEYEEGVAMLKVWHERTLPILAVRKVLSVENKTTFPLQTSIGVIPFTYIFDRFDEISPGVFEVVDYKTNRWGINPDDLDEKIQARTYALAASIQLTAQKIPYEKIWVRFDLLRHNSVAALFTRQDNIKTYRKLQQIAERIIATDEKTAPHTVNPTCLFCSIKATCPALSKNISTGGILSMSPEDMVDRRSELGYQQKAIETALKELDAQLIKDAQANDVLELVSPNNRLKFTVSKRRTVDADMVEMTVGPVFFDQYGGKSITLAQVEQMLKDERIPVETKKILRSLITVKVGQPSVKVESRTFGDD